MFDLSLIANRPGIRSMVFGGLSSVAYVAGIHKVIRDRSRVLYHEMPVIYALGFLYWFIALRFSLSLPSYNVYKYVGGNGIRAIAIDLIEEYLGRKHSFFASKQLFALKGSTPESMEVSEYVTRTLTDHFDTSKKEKAKQLFFEPGIAFSALIELDAVFQRIEVPMFLVSGTLLGCVRENGFVDGEYDIDVGFFIEDIDIDALYKLLMSSDLFKSGYKTEYTIQVVHNSGILFDLFAHFRTNGLVYHGSTTHHWYNSKFSLVSREFNGHEFLVPSDYKRYLLENYGNWEHPVAFWFYSFDTPNQVFPKTIDALFYLVDIVLHSKERFRVEGALARLDQQFGVDFTHVIPSKEPAEIIKPLLVKRVVMLLGRFDVIQHTDLVLLNKAAALGDYLVVGVLGDELVQGSSNEPSLVSQDKRIELVASIKSVDRVFPCDTQEMIETAIQRYQVSVLVNCDYLAEVEEHIERVTL